MAPIALDRLLDPVGRCLSPEVARRMIALPAEPDVLARLEYLAERSTEGQSSNEERSEYEALVRALDFVAVLQAKARMLLAANP